MIVWLVCAITSQESALEIFRRIHGDIRRVIFASTVNILDAWWFPDVLHCLVTTYSSGSEYVAPVIFSKESCIFGVSLGWSTFADWKTGLYASSTVFYSISNYYSPKAADSQGFAYTSHCQLRSYLGFRPRQWST